MSKSAVPASFSLTVSEKQIFDTLIRATQKAGIDTTLRCAGGWVRDKLLGKSSDDIDIALDNLLGKEFAEKVNEYLSSEGKEIHTVGVIQCNPDQSKHLETARMKVCDVWLDLVNLRSETYADGSRIPEMTFGTPEQDAYRRDFTINALFYNINDGTVEDLTLRGLDDLRDGIIRTPLDPMETFTDDPLRVLRAVRFASRFGFELESELVKAASSQQVREELVAKVSRERVGTELDGMLNGPNPLAAAQILQQLRLFPAVFLAPEAQQAKLGPDYGAACVAAMARMEAVLASPETKVQLGPEEMRLCRLAALLLPLRDVEVPKAKGKGGKHSASLPAFILRESLKRRAKDGEALALMHKEAGELLALWPQLCLDGEIPAPTRTALGQSIRRLKELWPAAVLLAPLLRAPEATSLGVDPSPATAQTEGFADPSADDVREHIECSNGLQSAIRACGLEKAYTFKPLLDGKEVMKLLGLTSGGPMLGEAMAKMMDWQLANPGGSAEECKAVLLANRE